MIRGLKERQRLDHREPEQQSELPVGTKPEFEEFKTT